MRSWSLRAPALAVVFAAAVLRFPALEQRPMHADEAVLADKLGTLIEKGSYAYDPAEHHGPALLYLATIPARLAGASSYNALTERMIRSVPAVAGTLLAVMLLLFARGLGARGAVAAAVLAALSPAMVYYSRYFIPETLLALFSVAALFFGWRYAIAPRLLWAVLAGISVGLMFATKETAILAVAAAAVAAAASGAWRGVRPAHALCAVVTALAVIAAAFGTATPDLFASFAGYASRAAAGGRHAHPWHFYLGLVSSETVWIDAVAIPLAIIGGVTSFRPKQEPDVAPRLGRFLAVYTLALAAVYSVIPYKTPWCLVSFWPGVMLLAGAGAAALLRGRVIISLPVLLAMCVIAVFQAHRAAFPYAADPRNPYVYAHTTLDVFRIKARVEQLAAAGPDRLRTEIQVFSNENVWPLPWYVRAFPNVRWWTGVPKAVAPAPVILVSPALEPALARLLYEARPPGERELYMSAFEPAQVRPRVELRGYAAKSLWEKAPGESNRSK